MSYCRFLNADVYVFDCVTGYLECCGCSINGTTVAETGAGMAEHLREHIALGHHVPDNVIPEVLADAETDDADRERRRRAEP